MTIVIYRSILTQYIFLIEVMLLFKINNVVVSLIVSEMATKWETKIVTMNFHNALKIET